MSLKEASKHVQVIGQLIQKHAQAAIAPFQSDIGIVMHVDPLAIKLKYNGLTIASGAFYINDGLEPSTWVIGDKLCVVTAGNEFMIVCRMTPPVGLGT
jgi:hypothetical protein